MDNEIRDMLIKLSEGQSRLESKILGLEAESKKTSIKLETIEKNIKTILELQSGHNDKSKISFNNTKLLITQKEDLLSTYQYLKKYIKKK